LRAYTQTTPTLFNKQTKLGMGYDTSRLVDAAPEQLLCGVCLDVFARPVVICAELHTLCGVLAAPFDEQPQHVERYAFPDPVLSRMPGVAVLS